MPCSETCCDVLEARYPAEPVQRIYVVVDHYQIHKAKAVEQWLAAHPRVTWLFLPTYGPRANPIERAFGDVHDCCTRNHRRKRLPDLVADVEDHLTEMAPGHTSCQTSTMSRRSPQQLRKSLRRNMQ